MIIQTFAIKGMHCASCSNVIEHALKKTKGVIYANVNIVDETVLIKFDPKLVSNDTIFSVIKRVGYQALILEEEKDVVKDETSKTIELNLLKFKVKINF